MNFPPSFIRQRWVVAFVWIFIGWAAPLAAGTNPMPPQIDPSSHYLIFLHNYYVEQKGPYGACRYHEILKAFENEGLTVISDVRPPGTTPLNYAPKVADQVSRLLQAGVPANHITVAGHSKGAVIGLCTAAELNRPDIRFVVMAGCGIKSLQKAYPDCTQLRGRFLSILATSDRIARSCQVDFNPVGEGGTFQEIQLDDDRGHKLFFEPKAIWLKPTVEWIRDNRTTK